VAIGVMDPEPSLATFVALQPGLTAMAVGSLPTAMGCRGCWWSGTRYVDLRRTRRKRGGHFVLQLIVTLRVARAIFLPLRLMV